jgi:predicted PhzF superfamily epimerase YddE/YHI9
MPPPLTRDQPGRRCDQRGAAQANEDVANANSVGCLAAHLLDTSGNGDIEVRQGDTLERPSSISASATHTGSGIVASIGGMVDLSPPIVLG